ncbi:MAG: hypothetical protein A2W85_13965 [Bacteroidetes bacterium GWF2_41_31]|nr:MAG: hypothetical protein A2W85_13965 [Bacteroidetes bacterium GWF2_41_31]OFZ04226.1 MAG: hypothetical protein A2338_10140 [Bacteroidetes bacterium RIFOXYB12_FULL_41_6]
MKKFTFSMLAAGMLLVCPYLGAQSFTVKQVMIGSGGNYANPDDFVELSSYDPVSDQSVNFGTVFTQSVQDVMISDGFLYVAAQDSIAKYDANTYERLAITAASGVNKLDLYEGRLLATFAYPVTENFVREFDASDLTFLGYIADVSDESAGMLIIGNRLYVAVPGGWTSITGKMAMIDLDSFELIDEVDLGSEAMGIYNLYLANNQIVTVNRSAWGTTTGNLTTINTDLSQFTHYTYAESIGAGIGVYDNLLYTQMNNGIGSVNLETMELEKSTVVEPFAMSIAAAKLDTVNGLFYITITDYSALGAGFIYNLAGEEQNTFDAGISAEAIAIDYRSSVGVQEFHTQIALQAYPNPTQDVCRISLPDELAGAQWKICDLQGRIYLEGNTDLNRKTLNLDLEGLQNGMYIITLRNNQAQGMAKVVLKP